MPTPPADDSCAIVGVSRLGGWMLWGAAGLVLAAVFAPRLPINVPALLGHLKAIYGAHAPLTVKRFVWVAQEAYSNPFNYLILAIVFVLERIIPANRRQRVFSVGLAQDFAWFLTDTVAQMTLLPVYLGLLQLVYDRYLGFLTIQAVAAWPVEVRVIVALLAFDLFNWVHHLLRHKVTVFWYFHMIHHSQREMNLFTDGRVHVMELLIAKTIIFIPVFMLAPTAHAIFWIAFVTAWYARVYHANLRTNYGPLKHILVTPQSHRIHHSLEHKHCKNFGVLFTIWDRMFGMLYANYDEYPATGLEDDRFPLEQTIAGLAIATNYLAQWLYPFRRLFGQHPVYVAR